MSDLISLSAAQMRRIEPYFPLPHGVPRVDDRPIVSGIIFSMRNVLLGARLETKILLGDQGLMPGRRPRRSGSYRRAKP